MTHKVHPKIFRTKELADWNSRWLDKKKFPRYMEEDFKIREFLGKKLEKIGIERVEIERLPGKINIIISTARPGLIIGRAGSGVEELKRKLEKLLSVKNPSLVPASGNKREKRTSSPAGSELRIEIREIKNPWLSAALSGQLIVQQIEKRMPFRRVLKQTLEKIISQKGVEGCRVEVAGRLDGSEIARTQWLKKGRLPRQTLRADIDYAQARAYCSYGVVGVKIWIYKGDKF